MRLTLLTSLTGFAVLGCVLDLLRRHQLREKYAAFWICACVAILPLSMFPKLLDSLALTLGVRSGVSLVLFAGFVLLLFVALHLSWETSRLEEETRTLSEEIALIRVELHAVQRPGVIRPAAGLGREDLS